MSRARTAAPIAVLDIGTNSIKLLVAVSDGRRVRRLHFARRTTRLGAGLDRSGRISRAAAATTTQAVRLLAARARRHGAARVLAVGTYAFRTARNGAAVAAAIERATGVEVRVLTGREEARLAFLSARSRLDRPHPVTFLVDVGGGSAQFVAAHGTTILVSRSLPLGALRLTERHLHQDPMDATEYAAMKSEIDRTIRPLMARLSPLAPRAALVAVGGSATTALAMVRRDPGEQLASGTIKIADLRRLEQSCLERTIAARRKLPGLPPDRADIMPAGIAVVLAFLTAAHKRVLHVSAGGVREGVILTTKMPD